jgi:Holliday junction resolvase RusA-like endonuclease
MRYTGTYAVGRDVWALAVRAETLLQEWVMPPVERRLAVTVTVHGGGKRDLDRVGTAVLDALQAGRAIKDDCLVDALVLIRVRLRRGEDPAVTVMLGHLEGE